MTVETLILALLTCLCAFLGAALFDARAEFRMIRAEAARDRARLLADEQDRARRLFAEVLGAMHAAGIVSGDPTAWAAFIAKQTDRTRAAVDRR